ASVVVVDVDEVDVGGLDRRVHRVRALHPGHDGVIDIAILYEVIDAGHRDRLGHAPVGGRERDGEPGCVSSGSALGGVGAGEGDGDIGRWLTGQHHTERGGPAGLGGEQPGGRRHGHAGVIVVAVGDLDVVGLDGGVHRVRA